MHELTNKRVLVMGLGLNGGGAATVRYLVRHGARVTVTDLRTKQKLAVSLRSLPKGKKVKYVLGRHRLKDFRNQDLIFRNPAVPSNSQYLAEAKKNKVPITNEADYFMRHTRAFVIGITGTRGKSTTSALIASILRHSRKNRSKVYLTGNIAQEGLLSVLDKASSRDIVVAEFSSFHLELFDASTPKPKLVVVTSIYHDHLNRYDSFDQYVSAKRKILPNIPGATVILNADSALSRRFADGINAHVLHYSATRRVKGAYLHHGEIVISIDKQKKKLIDSKEVQRLRGAFVENYLAAALTGYVQKIPSTAIRDAFRDFKGLRYRYQDRGHVQQRRIVNDSCSTAPIATEKALQFSDRRTVLIAGGVDKSLSYASLAKTIKRRKVTVVLLPGAASKKIVREFRSLSFTDYVLVPDLRNAVLRAFELSSRSDLILFSPGAASFNLFNNEFDRGSQFDRLIRNASSNKD